MTTDTAATLRAAVERYDAATKATRAAHEEQRAALDALNTARTAHNTAHPHPWVGKRVKRTVRNVYWNKTRTQRGTVTINTRKYARYIEHSPALGETFVLTDGGRRGYLFEGVDGWELDE